MGATRATLAAEVDRIIGNRGLAATSCITWVQRAHQIFQTMVEVPEARQFASVVIAAGTLETSLPADFFSVKGVTYENGEKLVQVSVQRYDALDRTVEGKPSHYTIDNTYLNTWPKADAEYDVNLRYRARLPLMSTDQSTTGCAIEYDPVVLYLAVAMALLDFEEHDKARNYESAASRLIGSIGRRQHADLDDRNEPMGVIGLVI